MSINSRFANRHKRKDWKMVQDTDKPQAPIAALTPEQLAELGKSIGAATAQLPVIAQITINLHEDKQVSLSWNVDGHVTFFGMLREAEISYVGYQKAQVGK